MMKYFNQSRSWFTSYWLSNLSYHFFGTEICCVHLLDCLEVEMKQPRVPKNVFIFLLIFIYVATVDSLYLSPGTMLRKEYICQHKNIFVIIFPAASSNSNKKDPPSDCCVWQCINKPALKTLTRPQRRLGPVWDCFSYLLCAEQW